MSANNRPLSPTSDIPASGNEWRGSARIRHDSPQAVASDHLALIRERIQKGFYQSADIDTDISDKLAQAFFDREG